MLATVPSTSARRRSRVSSTRTRHQLGGHARNGFAGGQEISLETTRNVAAVFDGKAALGPARGPVQCLQMPVGGCRNHALAELAASIIDRDECMCPLVGVNSQNDHRQFPRSGIELTRPTGGHACIEAEGQVPIKSRPGAKWTQWAADPIQAIRDLSSKEVSQPTGYRQHDIHAKESG